MTPARAAFQFGTHGPGAVFLSNAGVGTMLRKCIMDNTNQLHGIPHRALSVATSTWGMLVLANAFPAIKLTYQSAHVAHDAPRFLNQHAIGGFYTERAPIKVCFNQFQLLNQGSNSGPLPIGAIFRPLNGNGPPRINHRSRNFGERTPNFLECADVES